MISSFGPPEGELIAKPVCIFGNLSAVNGIGLMPYEIKGPFHFQRRFNAYSEALGDQEMGNILTIDARCFHADNAG